MARIVPPLPAPSRHSITTMIRRPLCFTQSWRMQSSAWSLRSSFSYSFALQLIPSIFLLPLRHGIAFSRSGAHAPFSKNTFRFKHPSASSSAARSPCSQVREPREDRGARRYSTGHGFTFQMSAAYSAILRSLENFPELATLMIVIFSHSSRSTYSRLSFSCVSLYDLRSARCI